MAWTAPRTWVAAETVDEDHMNEQIRDNMLYLKTPTLEAFFPVIVTYDSSGTTYYPPWAVTNGVEDTDDFAAINFWIPDNLSSLTSAYVLCRALDTKADTDIDIESMYATTAEAFNTHNETDAATTYAMTATKNFEIDVSGILTGVGADDYGYIKITNKDGTDGQFNVYGMKIEYTTAL